MLRARPLCWAFLCKSASEPFNGFQHTCSYAASTVCKSVQRTQVCVLVDLHKAAFSHCLSVLVCSEHLAGVVAHCGAVGVGCRLLR